MSESERRIKALEEKEKLTRHDPIDSSKDVIFQFFNFILVNI